MAIAHHTQHACIPWTGRPEEYQIEAYEAYVFAGLHPSHWAWLTSTCETKYCLQVEHLICNEPVHLRYPQGICIYCGRLADTVDHLLPRGFTGEANRRFTAIVPACRWCNKIGRAHV